MKWRIWQEKVLLVIRIKNHEPDTLCRQVYEEGRKRSWPGLAKEVSDICETIGIEDVNIVMVSKTEVKEAIFKHHYSDMISTINTKSKLEAIKGDDFTEVQEYFNEKSVSNSRMAFKVRSLMVPEIPGNFKNRYKVKGTLSEGLTCEYCQEGEIMTQSHCMSCPAWSGLREGLDLTNIKDLVIFFQKLMDERAKV